MSSEMMAWSVPRVSLAPNELLFESERMFPSCCMILTHRSRIGLTRGTRDSTMFHENRSIHAGRNPKFAFWWLILKVFAVTPTSDALKCGLLCSRCSDGRTVL
jgi:hypothetical protein